MVTTTTDRGLRKAAQRKGFRLQKLNGGKSNYLNNGYRILDGYTGIIVDGYYFELSPKCVRDFLNEH